MCIDQQGRDATPYFEKNRVGSDAIDSTAALTDMGKYLFQERRLPVYDIAVAVTKYAQYPGLFNMEKKSLIWCFSPYLVSEIPHI